MGSRGIKSCNDEEFINLFRSSGAQETADILGIDVRAVYRRRENLEKSGVSGVLVSPNSLAIKYAKSYEARIPVDLMNGTILIGSDAHVWPGIKTTGQKGFVHFAKELEPSVICLNGDVIDGARISRHSPLGWEQKPTLKGELEAVEEFTNELADASPSSKFIWTIGNHDARFEIKLASQVPEMEGVPGFELKDRFPRWEFGMSYWVNDNTVIKHRFKGGIHATHNNTLWAGKSVVTGHLHSLKVTPFADYNGNRFGVDTGTLNDPYGEHASYGEDNPLNHRSGFVLLTFHNGRLLWPEIAHVIGDGQVEFRGGVVSV